MECLRCRLCALEAPSLIHIEEDFGNQVLTLFHVQIGGPNDRLSCYVCNTCMNTVNATWIFFEKVQRAQRELIETLTIVQSSTKVIEDCVINNTKLNATETLLDVVIDNKNETEDKLFTGKGRTKKTKCRKSEETDALSGASDCEQNEDGSLIMQRNLAGWESYPWACCDCGQSVLSCEELRDHYIVIHGQNNRFACADCPKIYTKFTMFLTHVRTHRPYLKFCCDVCNKWFPSAKIQEKHRAEHMDERPYPCTTCGKRFRMQSALLVHSRSHLPLELKNRYQCDQCPKRFGTRPNLMAHKRIHAGVRDFTCDQCGKSFVQKGNLDNHLLTHTAVRPFSCSTCGKSFKTLVRLRKHGTVHSGLKPHQCDVCGRQFRERGTLKEHHRIHTGALPFTCEFCGKSFRFKGVLTTHRRQHTGERPYSCLECQHHFTNWPNYNKHMKRRHGINTSVTVRKPQTIPPTGMPQRNPPGSVLAPPQLPETHYGHHETHSFYPVLNLYNITDDLMQQRTVQ
ncbi:PREDICTED: gastrula zinc finger protein XlCGF26.1-like isoform X2 [Nicrophorus vespilloides]|uniref:Gastrula zinc finger protein XlCGF26.1-like isoform X2 n=1 Tax=Nicrophorus vespilloides TaxID=110193 RepID=A0ABM1MDM4_NICVS|nr:PREDICTED: gastrula zinc finger protein XlCGF26.1-like isoform X2 [Nicrophorus vespilloides]